MGRLIALTSVAMIAFAANSVLARLALLPEGADPLAYTGIRLASGAVALAIILAVFRRCTTISGSWSASGALFGYALAFSLAYVMLGAGTGAEIRQPLGYAMVGGLIVSQALTLFTTPVVYIYLDKLSSFLDRLFGTKSTEPVRNTAKAR